MTKVEKAKMGKCRRDKSQRMPRANRKEARKTAKQNKRANKKQWSRKRAMLKRVLERSKRRKSVKKDIKIGVWNCRGLGAEHAMEDPEIKLRALEKTWSLRKWNTVILTDVKYKKQDVRRINTQTDTWIMVQHGRVAVVLDDVLAAAWRKAGAKIAKGKGGQKARCMRLDIPTNDWRKGLSLLAAYAPTSAREHNEERRVVADEVLHLLDSAPKDCRVVVGGDWNAEVGSRTGGEWKSA